MILIIFGIPIYVITATPVRVLFCFDPSQILLSWLYYLLRCSISR